MSKAINRIVIESLAKQKSANLIHLSHDTGLDLSLLNNLLSNLIEKKIVILRGDVYSLNWENKAKWMDEMNSKESSEQELKEVIKSMINVRETVKLQKVYLDPYEEKILNKLFMDIEDFIERVKENKKDIRTCEQKVISWSIANYGSVISDQIIRI